MNQQATPETTGKYPGQLFGIIILTVIGAIVIPVRLIDKIFSDILPLFKPEGWSAFTTPGSEAYYALFRPILVGELVGSIILAAWAIILAVMFFVKRKLILNLALIFLVIHFIFVLADFLVVGMMRGMAQIGNASSLMDVTKAAVAVMVWFLYFKVSKKRMGEGR